MILIIRTDDSDHLFRTAHTAHVSVVIDVFGVTLRISRSAQLIIMHSKQQCCFAAGVGFALRTSTIIRAHKCIIRCVLLYYWAHLFVWSAVVSYVVWYYQLLYQVRTGLPLYNVQHSCNRMVQLAVTMLLSDKQINHPLSFLGLEKPLPPWYVRRLDTSCCLLLYVLLPRF